MSAEDIKQVAVEAARAAVSELFLTMGVDTSDSKSLLDLQRDFAHVRAWREASETVKNAGLKAAVGVLVTGFLGAVYWFITSGPHPK